MSDTLTLKTTGFYDEQKNEYDGSNEEDSGDEYKYDERRETGMEAEEPFSKLLEYTMDDLPDYREEVGRIIYVTKPDGKKYIAVSDLTCWKFCDKPID